MDDVSHVFLAKYLPLDVFCMLKLTDLEITADQAFLAEIVDVSLNTALCRHENILRYHTAFVENERLWTVTDLVRAGSCKQLMNAHFQSGLPSELVIATILRGTLKALDYLHESHRIHNNIRADSIYLDSNGDVKLAGMHQLINAASDGKLQRSVFKFVGDPEWMAPEVLSQATTFNNKADIYSLGITALEMAYNKTPFENWPALKILLCKLQYECPTIESDKVPTKMFQRFVERCLDKNPAQRPSAWQLLDDPFIRQARNAHYLETHLLKRILSAAESPTSPLAELQQEASTE